MSKPQLSVVLPARNEPRLQSTLRSLLETTDRQETELVVVDDGSTDDSCARIPAEVRVVRSTGIGCAAAKNLGATAAEGTFIAFCDAHMTFDPDWDRLMIDVLEQTPGTAFAVPRVAAHDNGDAAGCGMVMSQDLPVPQFQLRWLSPQENALVPIGCGMCQLWRSAAFERVGRFNDEMYPWGGEDVEISLRAALLGYAIAGVPASRVSHVFRPSFPSHIDGRCGTANDLRLAMIHFSAARLTGILESLKQQWSPEDFAFIFEYACTTGTVSKRKAMLSERVMDTETWLQMMKTCAETGEWGPA